MGVVRGARLPALLSAMAVAFGTVSTAHATVTISVAQAGHEAVASLSSGAFLLPDGSPSAIAQDNASLIADPTRAGSEFAAERHLFIAPQRASFIRILGTAASVPEPATWATMFAGMAAVGFAMRRRARTGEGTQAA